jgi:hypothetical protein
MDDNQIGRDRPGTGSAADAGRGVGVGHASGRRRADGFHVAAGRVVSTGLGPGEDRGGLACLPDAFGGGRGPGRCDTASTRRGR